MEDEVCLVRASRPRKLRPTISEAAAGAAESCPENELPNICCKYLEGLSYFKILLVVLYQVLISLNLSAGKEILAKFTPNISAGRR